MFPAILIIFLTGIDNIIAKDNFSYPEEYRIVQNSLQTSIGQTFIDIYVFTNSSNDACRNASLLYAEALKNFDPWALEMLDASSKLQSGFIAGNIVEYGSYTQCIKIHYKNQNDPQKLQDSNTSKDIKGKYCLLGMQPPEDFLKKIMSFKGLNDQAYRNVRKTIVNSTLEWSICIPDVCDSEDILEHFEGIVQKVFEGLDIFLSPQITCSTLEDVGKPFNTLEKIVLCVVTFIVLLAIISTILEMYKLSKGEEEGFEVVFSLMTNARWINARNKNHLQLQCLNGIRTLTIMLVIMGHRYLMSMFFTAVNTFEFLDWMLKLPSQMIIGGTVCVDSFLLMSGSLVTYHFLLNLQNGRKFNMLFYLLHRYIRLTPSYAVVILIVTTFSPRFGDGPKWAQSAAALQQPCIKYWWSALLYIQSYVNSSEICILQTWSMTIDTWYYVFAPMILIPLAKDPRKGWIIMFVVYIASIFVSFQQAYKYQYEVPALFDNHILETRYFQLHYTQPHTRAHTYILGMAFGYILFKYRDRKVWLSRWSVILGWTGCIAVLATIILCNRIFVDPNYVYERFASSLYISVHRSAWALALTWLIWACANGYGGPVNAILSSHIFAVLGRLTYSAFLIHMQIQFLDNGANQLPNYFSNMTLIRKGFADIGLLFFFGYFLTIFVEYPFYRLSLLLFKGRKKIVPNAENGNRKTTAF